MFLLQTPQLIENVLYPCLCRNNFNNVGHQRSVAEAKDDTYKALCQRCQYVFMLQQELEISGSSKYNRFSLYNNRIKSHMPTAN